MTDKTSDNTAVPVGKPVSSVGTIVEGYLTGAWMAVVLLDIPQSWVKTHGLWDPVAFCMTCL